VHHHCLLQVEVLQLPQEEHPLMRLLSDGADDQLPFEVLGSDGAQKAERHGVICHLQELDRLVTGGAAVSVQGE